MPDERTGQQLPKTQPWPPPGSTEVPRATLYINVVGFAKAKEFRSNAEDPGDVVREIPGGAVLLDGAGGEGAGDDWKVAKIVGQRMSEEISNKIRNIQPNPIQNGNTDAIREVIIAAFSAGSEAIKTGYNDGILKHGADTTANIAMISRTSSGRVLVSANAGDGTTFIRNRRTGQFRVVSTEHSTVASMKAAGLDLTEAEELAKRHEVYRFVGSLNPNGTSDQIARQIDLKETPLTPDEDVFMTSDSVTDNFQPDHLRDLSVRSAAESKTISQFVRSVFDVARDISLAGVSSRAKPDDYSAVAISTEFK